MNKDAMRELLRAAANYIDALGGDSKNYRAALAAPAQSDAVGASPSEFVTKLRHALLMAPMKSNFTFSRDEVMQILRSPAQSEAKPVYQIHSVDEGWEDVDITEYEEWAYKKRIVYPAPPSAESARDAALEEAARMCDSHAYTKNNNGQSCAQAIRALKSKKEAQ